MTMSNVSRWQRWFSYEQDVHQQVLASIQTVPEEKRSAPAYQKAVDLFAHIIAARQMWLFRFGVADDWLQELFPQDTTIEAVVLLTRNVQAQWSAYLAGLGEKELARVFTYQSLEGQRFNNTIEDILTQLFGHSWYHRGQIAALVRSLGGQPAVTDFVYWSRDLLTTPEK